MLFRTANAKKEAKEFGKLLAMYQEQINELIEQLVGWKELAMDFRNSVDCRTIAKYHVTIITKNIAELEAARQRFIEESF